MAPSTTTSIKDISDISLQVTNKVILYQENQDSKLLEEILNDIEPFLQFILNKFTFYDKKLYFDFMQEMKIKTIEAVNKYDSSSVNQFSTFLYPCIINRLKQLYNKEKKYKKGLNEIFKNYYRQTSLEKSSNINSDSFLDNISGDEFKFHAKNFIKNSNNFFDYHDKFIFNYLYLNEDLEEQRIIENLNNGLQTNKSENELKIIFGKKKYNQQEAALRLGLTQASISRKYKTLLIVYEIEILLETSISNQKIVKEKLSRLINLESSKTIKLILDKLCFDNKQALLEIFDCTSKDAFILKKDFKKL